MRLKALVWILRPGSGGPQVLLLQRPKGRGGGEHPVTGKADRGESASACAEREALEETGLRGELVELRFVHDYAGRKGVFEEHAFLLRAAAGAIPVLSHEHVAFRWASAEQAREAVRWGAHARALELALGAF
ncbi:MAG TPA: NUDIX domain-containing protein [Myxococcales bacterium]|nr:NUDIX domain-containing protein [Myxococcales bacterium]